MAHSLGVIDPTVLDRLSNLEFVARKAVEGFMAGHHRTPHRGSSVDFAQHRPYAAGDELRKIDWKVFARSDRLVVKEYVEETNLSLNLLLDASESMGYGSLDWNKLDYARWCAASLAHLVLGQRDTVGLVVFDEDWRAKVPPGNGARQEVAVFGVLADAQPIGKTSVGGALNRLGPRLKQRGITAIFSDFFEDLDTIIDGIKRLLHEGHEPILFQILDPEELEFNFDHLVKLEGLEDAGKRKIDPRAIREAYIEEITRHNRELARATAALNVDCILARTDEPLDAVISTYLTHRAARARGGGQGT